MLCFALHIWSPSRLGDQLAARIAQWGQRKALICIPGVIIKLVLSLQFCGRKVLEFLVPNLRRYLVFWSFLHRMTLLLGPPSSGRTSLLLALAASLEPSVKVNITNSVQSLDLTLDEHCKILNHHSRSRVIALLLIVWRDDFNTI
jgi:hypothetical protein